MSNELNSALRGAVLKILRPLVRILLRHGIAYGSFAELARKAYVDVAFEEPADGRKKSTISSVSAATGLTRKETRRLRELNLLTDDTSQQRYSRAVRVISGWVNDSRFQGADGQPALLPMEGATASFSDLVKIFSGDIPPTAMLSVLQASGSVESSSQGVRLLSRAYLPTDTPLDKINILGADVAELIATIGHNIDPDTERKLFQRKVSNVSVREDALEAFSKLSEQKSQQLLEEYHTWLSDHQVSDSSDEPGSYVAVGIYYAQGRDEKEKSE